MSRENSYYKHKYRELLKVIEDIKADIYEELKNDEGASYGLGLALGIIDKHISGKTIPYGYAEYDPDYPHPFRA